jgi:hypothetical protein
LLHSKDATLALIVAARCRNGPAGSRDELTIR